MATLFTVGWRWRRTGRLLTAAKRRRRLECAGRRLRRPGRPPILRRGRRGAHADDIPAARAVPGQRRIDAIAASGGIAADPVVVPRDDDSLTTLVDRIAVDVNGALTIHFGEDIRSSPPSATIVSAVEGLVPETAHQECESSRSSLIVTRMMPVPAPEAAGEACTPRAADAAKAGPLPSSSVPAVGAATEHGPPIGDVDASRDEATQQAEGDRAAARLQARVRGHQSRLGSTTPFVKPVKEFDAPPGAGTPNQRGAFETWRQAVDDAAASVAKVDVTLNEVGATGKEDGESVIATVDGRSPQVERVNVVALQMARTRGPPPLGPHDAPFSAVPEPGRAAIDQSRATPSRDAMHRAPTPPGRGAQDLRREPDDARCRHLMIGHAPAGPSPQGFATARCPLRRRGRVRAAGAADRVDTASDGRADDRAPFKRSYEARHRRKRDEARARREQLMEALVRAERERERRIDDRRAALRERHGASSAKRAGARAGAAPQETVGSAPRPADRVGSPGRAGRTGCVAVVPEVKKTTARARLENVFCPRSIR